MKDFAIVLERPPSGANRTVTFKYYESVGVSLVLIDAPVRSRMWT